MNQVKLLPAAGKKKIIGDNKKKFEQEEHYYKPVRVGSNWNNNYVEY